MFELIIFFLNKLILIKFKLMKMLPKNSQIPFLNQNEQIIKFQNEYLDMTLKIDSIAKSKIFLII